MVLLMFNPAHSRCHLCAHWFLPNQLQAVGVTFMTGPLGQIVVDVDNPQAEKNVAGGFEGSRDRGDMPEVEKGRKRQPHSASFVGDQRSTAAAAHFARENSLKPLRFTVKEFQVVDSFHYPDVTFMKDGCPLHGRTVQFLTGQTMTEFCIHRIRTHFVLNRTAMAPGTVFRYECLIFSGSIIRSEFVFH
jgi:hypothetical protein